MQFFVQLTFTTEGAEAIRSWQGRVTTALGIEPELGLEPHLTLGAGEVRAVEPLRAALQAALQNQPAFTLTLAALGTFGVTRGILFLSPSYNRALFALYEALQLPLATLSDSVNPLYTPERWTPHCTLFMNLSAAQLTQSVGLLAAVSLPLTLRAQRVELCSYPHLEVLESWTLTP